MALKAIVFFGRSAMVSFFIDNAEVTQLSEYMVALSMVTGPIFGISQLCTTFLQSTDKAFTATFASLLRQGVFLLPLIFILNAAFALNGLLWSSVAADILATIVTLALFARHHKAMSKKKPDRLPIAA